jgi:two-component SAPR family response regulator
VTNFRLGNFCTRLELPDKVFGRPMNPNPSLSKLRVLVVEDEGLVALNLERILHRFGCEVIGPISEVDEIIGMVVKHRPQGALLDVNLRGRKIFDVLPELMSFRVPFVLVSGYDDPTLFPPAFRDLPRIVKPFDESMLQRVCLDFLIQAERFNPRRQPETAASRSPEAKEPGRSVCSASLLD